MRLRDEQLRARVVFFEPDQETNAELDAITARVIADLQQLQQVGLQETKPIDPQAAEIELIAHLRKLMEKMISPRRETFVLHKIEQIQRRIAKLFIASFIHADAGEGQSRERRVFRHGDEALVHVLRVHESVLVGELDTLRYGDERVKNVAIEQLRKFQRKLINEQLTRSKPDLERILAIYRDVLSDFFLKYFPVSIGEMCWEVVRESQVVYMDAFSYKIGEMSFPAFRAVFERKFLDHLLSALQEPLADRLSTDPGGNFREETLHFAADPRVYAEICAVSCNAFYEYLHGEGFLDLPVTWQRHVLDG